MDGKPLHDSSLALTSSAAERRAAALRAEEERAMERRIALDSQAAPQTAPQERIRIWERLHALRLPVSTSHPLLRLIAQQTGLSLHDIAEEQRRRLAERGQPHRESP